jgi:hypothetical protein
MCQFHQKGITNSSPNHTWYLFIFKNCFFMVLVWMWILTSSKQGITNTRISSRLWVFFHVCFAHFFAQFALCCWWWVYVLSYLIFFLVGLLIVHFAIFRCYLLFGIWFDFIFLSCLFSCWVIYLDCLDWNGFFLGVQSVDTVGRCTTSFVYYQGITRHHTHRF